MQQRQIRADVRIDVGGALIIASLANAAVDDSGLNVSDTILTSPEVIIGK